MTHTTCRHCNAKHIPITYYSHVTGMARGWCPVCKRYSIIVPDAEVARIVHTFRVLVKGVLAE